VTRSRTLLDAAYGTELALATERCAAVRRPQPAVDPADAQAELIERSASLDAAARPTATESAAIESAAIESAAIESAATESAATESAVVESAAAESAGSKGGASGIPFTAGRRWSGSRSASVTDEHPHCPDCERRARVNAASLLAFAPAPVLPGSLRHRVLHTASDPELAGYRADIAARGGALTPAGLPTQPDMPSPFTKRWLFAGGGMAGALVTALLGAMLVGPGLGDSTIYWPPFRARPQPSISHQPPGQPQGSGNGQESPRSRSPQAPGVPPPGSPNGQGASPPGSSPSPSSPVPPEPGTLTVSPGRVELYMTKTAKVRVAASRGPVSWTATSSSNQITVSRPQGELPEDGTADVTVTLRTHLINLPGEATVTFTDPVTGATRPVTVVWGASLL
jgi:hypothetical protein